MEENIESHINPTALQFFKKIFPYLTIILALIFLVRIAYTTGRIADAEDDLIKSVAANQGVVIPAINAANAKVNTILNAVNDGTLLQILLQQQNQAQPKK